MMKDAGSSSSRRWITAAVIAVVGVPLLAFGFQTGRCVDYAVEVGAESFCGSGPSLGLAGAWLLTVVAVLFTIYAIHRGLRAARAGSGADSRPDA